METSKASPPVRKGPLTLEGLHQAATAPRSARIATLQAERQQHLTRLFFAVKDKQQANRFEAGFGPATREPLSGDAMQLDGDEWTGFDEFAAKYQDLSSLATLDLLVPAMSPSPPPSSQEDAVTPSVKEESGERVRDTTTAEGDATSVDADADGEMDADGDDDTPGIPTPSDATLAPIPAVRPLQTASATSSATDPPAIAGASLQPPPPQPPLKLAPSPSSALPSPFNIPTASTSALPYVSPSLVSIAPSSATVAPSAFTSAYGISAISSNYTSTLPELPNEVLRNRLNSSIRKKGKEKTNPPPDLYKMHSKAQHTGAKNFLGRNKRVHNVLSTHDWGVGLEELRAIRAFDKIEQLKAEKAWSFRQPKKQRVGVVPKAHWDHLLDEMRWLHTDFRQERRWKVTTAFNLARAVRAWHRASPEERKALCINATPPMQKDVPPLAVVDDDAPVASTSAAIDPVVEMDVDAGEVAVELAADADADGEVDADADGEADADADDALAPPAAGPSTLATPTKPLPPGIANVKAADEALLTPSATSAVAGAPPTPRSAAAQQAAKEAAAHIQNIIAFRAPVFELGVSATVVDPSALTSTVDDTNIVLSISALFPDLPLYSDFLLASDPAIDRRIEDSSAWAGRLTHVTKLLESKPLLVSTVQPAKTLTRGAWEPETSVVVDDTREVTDPREIMPHTASLLFAGPKPKAKESAGPDAFNRPPQVDEPDARAASLHWAPEEDQRVVALAKQYGFNWTLISDVFNGAFPRPASDYRLPWDLFDRWDKLVGPSSRKILGDGTEISVPLPEYVVPVDRTGKAPQFANFDGSKKRLRHLTVFDAMRKTQKIREAKAAKLPPPGLPRRVNMGMHESHNLPPRPSFTPMEWGQVKVEQDQNKARMRQVAQAEYALQQQRLRDQQAAAVQQQQNGVRYQQQGVPQGFPPQQPMQLDLPTRGAHGIANGAVGTPGTPPVQGYGDQQQQQQLTPEQMAAIYASRQAAAAQAHAQAQAQAQHK